MPVGEPDKDECPVGEPEAGEGPVNLRPGERPSQEGLGRYASDAGTAKRRDRPGEREIHGGISPARQATQGEPEKNNSPVDCCPGERPSQEGLGRYASDAGTAKRRGEAQAARRARENARRRSLYYVEHTTERDVGTTPGMEDDCRDAGGRATQERLPS